MNKYEQNQDIYAAIDLGSATIKAVAAYYNEFGHPTKAGVCIQPAAGIRKGAILNLETSVNAINAILSDLEAKCGNEIYQIMVSFSSEHVLTQNSDGVANVGLRGKPRAITIEDVEKVMDSAQAVPLPENREVAAIIPLHYRVDNQITTRNPINMQAVRLESRIHIVTAPGSLLNNLEQAIRSTGRQIQALVYSPLACAQAVLSKSEREEGVILIEMGASTTKIIFYTDEQPHYSSVLPIGSSSLTKDLAEVEQLPLHLAEQIKIEHGLCYRGLLNSANKQIPIPPYGGRGASIISEAKVCDILSARMSDIANAAKRRLEQSGWLYKAKSIVVAGGGSQLPGSSELFGKIFQLSSRSAYVMGVEDLSEEESLAAFGSAWGLIKQQESVERESIVKKNQFKSHDSFFHHPSSPLSNETHTEEDYPPKTHQSTRKNKPYSTLKWIKDNFF